jgi:hypothetical protein
VCTEGIDIFSFIRSLAEKDDLACQLLNIKTCLCVGSDGKFDSLHQDPRDTLLYSRSLTFSAL